MISIARLLLFFVITMGYNAFLRNTVKMNRSLTWVFTFSVITLVLYLGSLLGFMLQTVYVISVLGCLLSLYYLWAVWKKKYRFGRLDYIALGMMAYLLLFGITLWHSPLLHYDNFTHWATIVKFSISIMLCQHSRIRLLVIIPILLEVHFSFIFSRLS